MPWVSESEYRRCKGKGSSRGGRLPPLRSVRGNPSLTTWLVLGGAVAYFAAIRPRSKVRQTAPPGAPPPRRDGLIEGMLDRIGDTVLDAKDDLQQRFGGKALHALRSPGARKARRFEFVGAPPGRCFDNHTLRFVDRGNCLLE